MIREICLGKRLTDNRLFGEAFSKVLHDMKNDLPVFCVSSHAYNHFCDSENEKAAGMGFNLKGQTGIGDLRDFCEKMESRDRVVDYKAFLTDVQQVLLQLKSWTEGAFTCAAMTEDEMEEEVKYFRDSMENLTTVRGNLASSLRNIVRGVQKIGAEVDFGSDFFFLSTMIKFNVHYRFEDF